MFRGLANGNNANVFTTLSMRNGRSLVLQQTQGKGSTLTIGLTGVFSSESKPAEDLLGIAKVDAVLFQVCRVVSPRPKRTCLSVATVRNYGKAPPPAL
jgi:hypothetical protein